MSLAPWTTWLTKALEQLYQPLSTADESNFGPRFYDIFSPDAEINVNHENVSVSALEKRIKDDVIAESSKLVLEVKVDWKETFDVPETDGEGGIVAGYFIVTRTMTFFILGGHAQTLGDRFFSAKVVKLPQNDAGGKTQWRVSQFFLTEIDRPAPIHLAPQ